MIISSIISSAVSDVIYSPITSIDVRSSRLIYNMNGSSQRIETDIINLVSGDTITFDMLIDSSLVSSDAPFDRVRGLSSDRFFFRDEVRYME